MPAPALLTSGHVHFPWMSHCHGYNDKFAVGTSRATSTLCNPNPNPNLHPKPTLPLTLSLPLAYPYKAHGTSCGTTSDGKTRLTSGTARASTRSNFFARQSLKARLSTTTGAGCFARWAVSRRRGPSSPSRTGGGPCGLVRPGACPPCCTGYAYHSPACCTYQRRRAACPLGASLYCTHAVRVPASGVPYVPRTVAPQVAVLPKCLARMLHAVHGQGRVRAPPVRLVRPRLQLLQRQLQCQPLGRSQRVPQQHWAHLGQRRRAARGR